MSDKKLKDRSELADQLKKLVNDNSELVRESALDDLKYAIDELYEDESDPDYENSYEES